MHTKPPSADVDLTAANVAAMADLQAELTAAPAAAEATPAKVDAKVDTPVVDVPATVVETPAPAVTETAHVEIPAPAAKIVDEDAIPDDPEELKKGYLRHRDYTKKTMTLADERKAAQVAAAQAQQVAQEAQRYYQEALQWRQLAADQDALDRFAEQQRAARNVPAADEPISYAQLQQIRQADEARLRSQMAEQFQQELVKVEMGRQEAQFFAELDAQAASILEKHPPLKSIRGVTRLIVEDARARKPQTAAEFKRFMAEEAEERAREIGGTIKNHEQAAIMRHAKAATPAITPPGGAIAAVQAPTKRLRMGSTELWAQMEQDLLNEKQR